MTIEVQVGDTTVEFPDGTPPDVMRGALQKRFGAPPQPDTNAATFASRFNAVEPQGPQAGFASRLLRGFENQGAAAGQLTTPDISAHMPHLISDQVHENDAGEAMYIDPATGKLQETNAAKQVVLRDPSDNRLKVFARSPDTEEGRASAAGRLLLTGSGAGAPNMRAGISAATPKASQTFAAAKPYYRGFEEAAQGIAVPPETATGIADNIRHALSRGNLIPELAQPVYSAVGILDKGEPLTLDALQNVKRVVGRSFNSPDKNVRDAASIATREIGRALREISPEAGSALETADQTHATALALQDLQRKEAVAGLRTGRAGYGGNAVNNIRQVLSPIVEKAVKGEKTLYKPNEISAMNDIVQGSNAVNSLRGISQLSPSKGSIATGIAIGTGGVSAGIGATANKLATILTQRQFDRLKELVAARSPAYAQAVDKAVDAYERSRQAFMDNPSTATLHGFIGASRQLSNGLTRDGIAVTSGDLLRNIDPSRAEDEQQESSGNVSQ